MGGIVLLGKRKRELSAADVSVLWCGGRWYQMPVVVGGCEKGFGATVRHHRRLATLSLNTDEFSAVQYGTHSH